MPLLFGRRAWAGPSQFVERASARLGLTLAVEGQGKEAEVARVTSIESFDSD